MGRITIKEITAEKLLRIILEKKLCFKQQVKSICRKAHQKLHGLLRISDFLDTEHQKQTMQEFIYFVSFQLQSGLDVL